MQKEEKSQVGSYIVEINGKKVDALDLAARGELTRSIYQTLGKPVLQLQHFDKEFYTITEVARITGYGPSHIWRLRRLRRITTERRGGWVISRTELTRFKNSVSTGEASKILGVSRDILAKKIKEGTIEEAYPWGESDWRISYETINKIHRQLAQTVPLRRAWSALQKSGVRIHRLKFPKMVRNLEFYFPKKRIQLLLGQKRRLDQELSWSVWDYYIDLMDFNKLVKLLQFQGYCFENWYTASEVARIAGRSISVIAHLAGKGLIPVERIYFNGRSLIRDGFRYRFSKSMTREIVRKFKTITLTEVAKRLRDRGLVSRWYLVHQSRNALGINTKSAGGGRPAFYEYEVDLLIQMLEEKRRFTNEEKLKRKEQFLEQIREKYQDPVVVRSHLDHISKLTAKGYYDLSRDDEQLLIELVKLGKPEAIHKFEQLYRPLVFAIAKRVYPGHFLADKISFGQQGLRMACDRLYYFGPPFHYYAASYILGEIMNNIRKERSSPETVSLDEITESDLLEAWRYSTQFSDVLDEDTPPEPISESTLKESL